MIEEQRNEIMLMIQDLNHEILKYLPIKKSLEDLEEELRVITEQQTKLNDYLEFTKHDIIKNRVRPGKERISILKEEQELFKLNLAGFKQDFVRNHQVKDDQRYAILWGMVQEQDVLNLKMQSLLGILDQVVNLQQNQNSIETWINKAKDSADYIYIRELQIRMKCFTSQERLDSLQEIKAIKDFEATLFRNRTPFERELKMAVQGKSNSLIDSIRKVEKLQDEKLQNYILLLCNQRSNED